MKKGLFLIVSVCVFMMPGITMGSGFSIFEQGGAAMGMAGAFSAQADDPSAIFYNPAGITQLEGTQISIGVSLISPEATLRDPLDREWHSDDQLFTPPNLYITHNFNNRFNLGFGFGAPFGLGMKWDESEFVYRYLIREVNIKSYYFNPVAAYQVNDIISVAAGLYYVLSDVDLSQSISLAAVSPSLPDGSMTLDGDNGSGDYGFNLGVHAKYDAFRFGFTYRSEVECAYEGVADFTVMELGIPEVDAVFADSNGSTTITMPSSASLGVAYDVNDKLTVEFDLNWAEWSSYKQLALDFENPYTPDVTQEKNWDDVFSYRFGAKYKVSDAMNLYGGYYFDESPIPDETLDPILPGADRHSLNIGVGYKIGDFQIDAYYMALFFMDRDVFKVSAYDPNKDNYPEYHPEKAVLVTGDYKYESFSHIGGIQLTYRF